MFGEKKFFFWDDFKVWYFLYVDFVSCYFGVLVFDDVIFILEMFNFDFEGKLISYCGCDEIGN